MILYLNLLPFGNSFIYRNLESSNTSPQCSMKEAALNKKEQYYQDFERENANRTERGSQNSVRKSVEVEYDINEIEADYSFLKSNLDAFETKDAKLDYLEKQKNNYDYKKIHLDRDFLESQKQNPDEFFANLKRQNRLDRVGAVLVRKLSSDLEQNPTSDEKSENLTKALYEYDQFLDNHYEILNDPDQQLTVDQKKTLQNLENNFQKYGFSESNIKEIRLSHQLDAVLFTDKLTAYKAVIMQEKTFEQAEQAFQTLAAQKIQEHYPELYTYYSVIEKNAQSYEAQIATQTIVEKNSKVDPQKATHVVNDLAAAGLYLGLNSQDISVQADGSFTIQTKPKHTLDGVETDIKIKVSADGQTSVSNERFDNGVRQFSTVDELTNAVKFAEYNAVFAAVSKQQADENFSRNEQELKDDDLQKIITAFENRLFATESKAMFVFQKLFERFYEQAGQVGQNIAFYIKEHILKGKSPKQIEQAIGEGMNQVISEIDFGQGQRVETNTQSYT